MPMSLRARHIIARSKHRAAYFSVETETQFGPTRLRPDQGAKTTSRPWRRREWHLRGSVGDEAAERPRTGPCAIAEHFHDLGGGPSAASEHSVSLPSGAIAIDGAEAGAQPYCVGGLAGRLLDAEAEQLGSTSAHPFETEGLIGARRARAFDLMASSGLMAMSRSRCWGHS